MCKGKEIFTLFFFQDGNPTLCDCKRDITVNRTKCDSIKYFVLFYREI